MADAKRRGRPSAKEARARMTRAVGSQAPISRTETEALAAEEDRGLAPSEGASSTKAPATEKLVRLSVDVPTSKHRFLRVMAAQEGVSGMAVVRALIDELQDDEELAERVRERLAEDYPDR